MNSKVIAFKNFKLDAQGFVFWNNSAYDTLLFEVCLLDDKVPYSIPNALHDIFLWYKQIRNSKSQVNIQKTIKDIIDSLPPTSRIDLFWKYLNHLEIYKMDVLINAVYRQGYGSPKRIMNMLARLVNHANQSDATCFQVSVHFACKFFITKYPEYESEIRQIMSKEKNTKSKDLV